MDRLRLEFLNDNFIAYIYFDKELTFFLKILACGKCHIIKNNNNFNNEMRIKNKFKKLRNLG